MNKKYLIILVASLFLIFPTHLFAEETRLNTDDASIVAYAFIYAATEMEDSIWDENTIIVNSIDLYDNNDQLTAYCFELTTNQQETGYIVISANLDSPNLILEFSDKAEPLYNALDITSVNDIVYTGALGYYNDLKNGTYEDIYSNTVDANEVVNTANEARNDDYIDENNNIINEAKNDEDVYINEEEYEIDGNSDEAIINNPIDWANTHYVGPFVNYEWKNNYENYVTFRTTSDFSGYNNHCGPTTITNLVEMIGKYRGITSITSKSYTTIFTQIANLGMLKGYYMNQAGGSSWSTLNNYIKESFAIYGVNATVRDDNTVTYNDVKTQINADRPFYLSLNGHSSYGNHGVAGYAYTRFISETTGYPKSFIKIADGWAHYGRYIDMADITATNSAALRSIVIN
ncbi:MAG TPA: C39 family peptidase [Clostridiales bacterium]|nr:C39 family peptidase [Clostridiales bacterium]